VFSHAILFVGVRGTLLKLNPSAGHPGFCLIPIHFPIGADYLYCEIVSHLQPVYDILDYREVFILLGQLVKYARVILVALHVSSRHR
jgi:hypothetical protein